MSAVAPGLCGVCRHRRITSTKRGTAYLRCTRAAWDTRLRRYPTLPVHACVGFEPGDPEGELAPCAPPVSPTGPNVRSPG